MEDIIMPKKKAGEEPAATLELQTLFPPAPLPANERLYIGLDISKDLHHVGLVSATLLKQNSKWQNCPYLPIPKSREGFEKVMETVKLYAPLDRCIFLFEHTGHYSSAIRDFLLEQGVTAYTMHVKKRPDRLVKNDKRDSLALAQLAYNTFEKGMQPTEKGQELRRVVPDSPLYSRIRPLVLHRYELAGQSSRIQNQLHALLDELFPEFLQIFLDPNKPTALIFREKFPSAPAIAAAPFADLMACRLGNYPSKANVERLQELARTSIGCKDEHRLKSLVLEQQHLITLLALIQSQIDACEAEIEQIVNGSREGQILMSMNIFGHVQVATILSGISNIKAFPDAEHLKSHFGWIPKQAQTGTSLDSASLASGSARALKTCVYMAAIHAISSKAQTHGESVWKEQYDRLVERKCELGSDGKRKGKMKVVARMCGDILSMVYHLLNQDADLLASLKEGEKLPPPVFYDAEKHRKSKQDGKAARRRRGEQQRTEAKAAS
jgi:transposase